MVRASHYRFFILFGVDAEAPQTPLVNLCKKYYLPLAQFRTCLWSRVSRWASGQEAGQPPGVRSRVSSQHAGSSRSLKLRPFDWQPEAKPAHPALNGGRDLKQRRSGLPWSRWPSTGQHRRGLFIIAQARMGLPSKPKAARSGREPRRRRVSIARGRMSPYPHHAGRRSRPLALGDRAHDAAHPRFPPPPT